MNAMRSLLPLILLAGAATAGASPMPAQSGPLAMSSDGPRARGDRAMELSTSLQRGGYAVVIDLDENELRFRQGTTVLWSAPIGTGTGLRLASENGEWDFSTPNGVFHVQYKEENPVWIAPDWYFIENDLPVPPPNDRSRYFPGGLGAAAVYIGHDLAIHGTDKPELLGQRVSHGCIRLSDANAKRLFRNVQIGTEVVVVGGENVHYESAEEESVDPAKTFTPGESKPRPKDAMLERWKRMDTRELVDVLADELWMPAETSRWDEVADLLIGRWLANADDDALAGVVRRLGDLPNGMVEREYRTYLVDAYHSSPRRTLELLSDLGRRDRERAARAIVAASVLLYGGDLEAVSVPWPTRRFPERLVERRSRAAWDALAAAEREFREFGDVGEL